MLNQRRNGARRLLFGLGFGVILMLGAGAALAQSAQDVQRLVAEEAARSTVPPTLALAVARVESNFVANAQGARGTRGVMQIPPDLAKETYQVAADDLFDPKVNIRIGVNFLERLSQRYGSRWDLVLAHYFYGVGVDQPTPRINWEVRRYVDAVLGWQQYYERERTVAALQQRVARIAAATPRRSPDRREPPAYWTVDDAGGARDWRAYLGIADYWLSRRVTDSRAGTLAPDRRRPALAPERSRADGPAPTLPVDEDGLLPSERLRADTDDLRLRFRRYLESGERPWEYVSAPYRSDFDR